MVTITSRQNPLVARYRDAASGDARRVLLLDGAHLIADALRAGVSIVHAAVSTAARERHAIADAIAALERAKVEVAVVSASVMDAISPVRSSTGIVALANPPTHLRTRLYDEVALVVIAVGIQDPGNVGAIVRAAEAAGATGVIATGASANPLGWKALRGSMGSAFRLPLAVDGQPLDAVDDARRQGCRIVATIPRDGRSVYDADLWGPVAILVGGEGRGLAPELVDGADDRITIPMQPPVESLNAAITAALVLYEARRQRRHGRSTKSEV